VELVDRVFLSPSSFRSTVLNSIFSIESEKLAAMTSQEEEAFEISRIKHLTLVTSTCFIIAAKYDELDENIPLISDLQRYYTIKVLPP